MSTITSCFHSLFDSIALFLTLVCVIYASSPESLLNLNYFTYGTSRYQILSGFSNAVFILLVALLLLFESVHDLYKPKHIHHHQSLLAFIALGIDFIGLYFFKSYSMKKSSSNNTNERYYAIHGIWLHAIADTFLHLGIILSQYLTTTLGFIMAESIIFICISLLLVRAAYPLLYHTATILLHTTPKKLASQIQKVLREISFYDGILECRSAHWWAQAPNQYIGSIHVRVRNDVNEDEIIKYVHQLFKSSCHIELTVQIEKDQQGLGGLQ